MTDINNVFEELNAINEESDLFETTYTDFANSPDYQTLATANPWWFVSRCYHEYVDPSEVRYQNASKPSDRPREIAFLRAQKENRIQSCLLKILYNAAKHHLVLNTRNAGGISSEQAVDLAYAVLEKLARI